MKNIIDPVNTEDGLFHDGDPSTGAEGTIVYAKIMNAIMNGVIDIQTENLKILTEAGMKPDPSTTNQLLTALRKLFLVSDDKTVAGALQKSKNLTDLEDKTKAREALQLDKVGNWTAVQANGGKHSDGTHHHYIDWDGKLHYTVDDTDVGELFTTQNPPTAAQTGAYPHTGGNLDEEASITVISNSKNPATGTVIYSPMYRVVLKDRGGDQDFKDGASGFMRLVEEVGTRAYLQLQWDGFGTVHEFRFDQNGNTQVYGKAYTGSGASFLAEDGNVYGAAWGGYATSWVLAQINNNNAWINQSFITGHRQASAQWSGQIGSAYQVPAGCVVIGAQNNGSSDNSHLGLLYAAEQIQINGSWVTIGLV